MAVDVAVCCGVGGTGKTTTSAALAVGHALAGRRVAVLTIDPARRLADALGIERLGNDPHPVEVPGASGGLWALMLDRKGTWDAVIRSRATEETAQRLLNNPYYQAVSTRLSGSHEYMAVEKLHQLVHGGAFDVVVVDTPPTQHAVDFFRAPERVRGILDRSLLAGLLEPRGFRGAATRGALAVVHRLAGDGVMGDIREFFTLMGELAAGFRERSADIATLLTSEHTAYWLVANAEAPERNDLLGFLGELRERDMRFAGFLVNRVQSEPTGPFPTVQTLGTAAEGEAWARMAEALMSLPQRAHQRAKTHRRAVADLVQSAGGAPAWLIPEIPGGVRTMEGLMALSEHLPPGAQAARLGSP